MNILKSRIRFKQRIDLERDLLQIINGIFDNIEPLHGLTEATIDSWSKSTQGKVDIEIIETIKKISKKSALINDCSRDVFDIDSKVNLSSIKKMRQELIQKLKQNVDN